MSSRPLGRRDFLKSASMIAAAGLVTVGGRRQAAGMGHRSGGGSGGAAVDPPVGAPLANPPVAANLSDEPGIVQLEVEVGVTSVDVNGTPARLMTYNGSYPGPTIRVRRGDEVRLTLTNSLPPTTDRNLLGYQRNVTNLHTHGWHVSPEPPADGVMYELMPGQSYQHVYDMSLHEGGTLNLYHPHIHGTSAEQYWAGLMGALVVEDEAEEAALLAPYTEHILVLKDIALTGSIPSPHGTMQDYMHGKEGNIVLVNGRVNPRLDVKTGQVRRWRIVNASNARVYRLALESHTMYLIGTDGGLLDCPYARSEILLSPGERVDVLVKMEQRSGSYRLRALPYSRMGMMQSPTITLMTVVYGGKLSQAQSIPARINVRAARLDPAQLPIAADRTITLSMGHGNGYINGQDFDLAPYTIMSELGTFERWSVVNESGMDHPFHQHVNAAQVLSVTGGDGLYATIPAWKDTVLIPKWGSVTLLVPVMDYGGMTMFHCHILEHEDIGMMGMWHVMGMPM